MLALGAGGCGLNRSDGASFALLIVFAKNLGQAVALRVNPIGGYNIPPDFSQWPNSLSSSLSTSFQKSDFESDPSNLSLTLGPYVPITVATQVD